VISNPAGVAVATLEIPTLYDAETLDGITEVTNSAAVVPNGVSSGSQPDWPWQSPEVRDVQVTVIVSKSGDVLATGTGPKTIPRSHTGDLDNSWHASGSVSAAIILAAVELQVNGVSRRRHLLPSQCRPVKPKRSSRIQNTLSTGSRGIILRL